LERIADSLCQPSTPFIIPTIPKPDEIDSTLAVIGCRLRQMNRKTQLDVIQQIMNLTYNLLTKENQVKRLKIKIKIKNKNKD